MKKAKKKAAAENGVEELSADEKRSQTERTIRVMIVAAVATLALVALDLWTKDVAAANLSVERAGQSVPVCEADEAGYIQMQRIRGASHVLVDGYLEFSYAENCGAAFGLLRDAHANVRAGVFGIAAILATIFLFYMLYERKGGIFFIYSVPLIVSGALGNFIDRVRFGYVVDFIRFHVQDSFEYPTFNVADITITIGVILLVLDSLRKEADEKSAESSSSKKDIKGAKKA